MNTEKQKRELLETERFYHRAVTYLREEFPSKTKKFDDEELKRNIFSGCTKALNYGLESQEDAMAFVDLQWRFLENFDENKETPWAKEVLNDNKINVFRYIKENIINDDPLFKNYIVV